MENKVKKTTKKASKTTASAPTGEAATKVPKTTGKRHQHKSKMDTMAGITNPAIQRVARRGGVKRVSIDAYPAARDIMVAFLNTVVSDAVVVCGAAKKKTVTLADVHYALKRNNRPMYGCSL